VRETMRLAQQSSEQTSHFLCRCRHRHPLAPPTNPKPKPNQKKRNETKRTNETRTNENWKTNKNYTWGGEGNRVLFLFYFVGLSIRLNYP
jgi:hypothetical protein